MSNRRFISSICIFFTLSTVSSIFLSGCNTTNENINPTIVNSQTSLDSNIAESSEPYESSENSNSLKRYTIQLDSNPTTGYTWTYSFDKEGIIAAVKDEYISNENKKEVVGAGGKQYYTFEGKKEGDVTVIFKYARSTGEHDIKVKIVKLHIDANRNIHEKSKTDGYNLMIDSDSANEWTYILNNEGVINEVINEYIPDENFASKKGKQSYIFEGVEEGNVMLTFRYIGKNDNSAHSTKIINLSVDKNRNISEKSNEDSDSYQSFVLELNADKVTGFHWTYSFDKEGIIKETYNNIDNNKQYISFEGIKKGTVTITLNHTGGSEISDTAKPIRIDVDDNGNICNVTTLK